MKSRADVAWITAIIMAVTVTGTRADTYTIDGDQQIDGAGASATIALTSGDSVDSADDGAQWVFDFSTLSPGISVLDLASNKLYSGAASTETIALDLAGADLTGTNTVAINTASGSAADHIKLLNVRDVAIGGIQTVPSGTARSIQIGSEATPANLVQVAYLHAHGGTGDSSGGAVTIYSTNSVTITDSENNAGDILTHGNDLGTSAGDVKVVHRGDFLANSIKAHLERDYGGGSEYPGNIELDGGNASGDMTVLDQIRVSQETRGQDPVPFIKIANYDNVSIGNNIVGYCRISTGYATDVIVTNNISGDITVGGSIDLENRATSVLTRFGRLMLKAGGSITLAELDLAKVQYAFLNSGNGTGTSLIEGELYNFDTGDNGGTGTDADPFTTTQTLLRAPSGATIHYTLDDGQNGYLAGFTYKVADEDGNPGQGGLLKLQPGPPAIVTDPAEDMTQTDATLIGTLTTTGLTETVVSVHWGEGLDQGTDISSWAESNVWAAHAAAIPYEYRHDISVAAGKEYTYRYSATNDHSRVWGDPRYFISQWAGGTLTLSEDRLIDAESELLPFDEIDAPLRASGAGTDADPWLYDFSVFDPVPTTVDLSSNKLSSGESAVETLAVDLGGASLTGTAALAIDTTSGSTADPVKLFNVRDIAIGGIQTSPSGAGRPIQIGNETAPANRVQVAYLHANGGAGDSSGGSVTIHGTNDVIIADSEGHAGDILSHAIGNGNLGGYITVVHRGGFLANSLKAHIVKTYGGDYRRPGDIELDGGNASGDMTVLDQIRVSQETYAEDSVFPYIHIANYDNVSISNIVGYCRRSWGYAADVVVTNNISGAITIGGDVDLENRDTSDLAHFGRLMLKSGGNITLAELDLDKVQYAWLSHGGDLYTSVITGVVSNFNTTVDSGTGTETNPYVTAETRLRAPEDQAIYYTYEEGGLNDALGGHAWQLKDLDGSTDGGVLMTEPVLKGTLLIIR